MNQSRSFSTSGHAWSASEYRNVRLALPQEKRASIIVRTRRRRLREERQHMNVDRVNRIEDVLRAATLLVPVRKLADGDRDREAREVLFCEDDLFCKLAVREDVVEERLGPELQHPRHELGARVRVQIGEERVAAAYPDVVPVKAELWVEIHETG